MIIRVASGLAVLPGRHSILMGKRRPDKLRPNLWELPGGKIEMRGNFEESPRDALIREWKEELDVTLHPPFIGPILASSTLETEDTFIVELYPVLIGKDFAPRAIDHAELRWVEPEDAVKDLPCSPAFYLHYRAIVAWVKEVNGK
jgi:8-oxo-dGTP pyrophosphatase MutT (NUDIX family)